MTAYSNKFYAKAIEILKSNDKPALETVMDSKFPATDFGNAKVKQAEEAIRKAKQDAYTAAVKKHPRWHKAVLSGRSASECLKLWKEEGGNSYLQTL